MKSLALYRGPNGDPSVDVQLLGNGDLRLLSIQRQGVWVYSDIDTIAWWSWYTVSRADLTRLTGEGGDVLETVRAAVAPEDDGVVKRFQAWLAERGVTAAWNSYDEREA
ncbi:hypothetical protein SAMN05421748_117179 [Paractinoplanes atraurantiacus]|uniref:Uncharacterized protein n=1 Tax=Paractinoplanes atraurantiacus TaxID=1036182 RepID=A0A285J858_9ACTN|nr:hypothetical protein SAMN05421748_117179 [Actinoplanes atraurantiacus]